MRVCALTPHSVFNYFCGATNAVLKDFFFGSLGYAFCRPVTIYVSVSIKDIEDIVSGDVDLGPGRVITMVIGALIAIFILVVVISLTRREIKKLIEEEENRNNSASMAQVVPFAGEEVENQRINGDTTSPQAATR